MAPAVRKITQWSYSRWKTYSECPRKAKYQYIDKMRTPSSPAMDRGTAIHKSAEDYVKKEVARLAPELKHFKAPFKNLRDNGARAEGELAFTSNWTPTGWFSSDCWVRVKVDALLVTTSELVVVDYKTGKKYDDHIQQLSLYALAGLVVNPLVDKVRTQDWYLDIAPPANVLEEVFKRSDESGLKKQWAKLSKPMLSDTKFAPLPSRSCLWCPFSKAKGGPCEF